MSYETVKGVLVETVSRPPATDSKANSAYWITYRWLAQRLHLGEITTDDLLGSFAVKRTGAQRKFDVLFSDTYPNPTEELSPPELSRLAHYLEDVVALRIDSYGILQQDIPKTF